MHAAKVGWAGKAFALATSNDSGGKKSRIRRSKEERKSMVESFIKKYQESNNGNFPSLNLAHKEVGGSFYTVREIVREIIQENRVLAPPKVSSEEHEYSRFLEQHPIGSISMEPQIDMSESDNIHIVTHILPQKYQISSEENISYSSEQFYGSYPLELDNEQGSDGTSKSLQEQFPQPKSHELKDEKIVNGLKVLDQNPHSNEALIANVDRQDNGDINGLGSEKLPNENYNKNDEPVDKNKEFRQIIYTESTVTEILDNEKYEAQDVEASENAKFHVNSNVVVETFPLRPVPHTIHDINEAAGTLEVIQSSDAKADEKLTDERAVLNLQDASLKSSEYISASKTVARDIGGVADRELKDSLPDETNKNSSSTECVISEDSTSVGRKSINQENSSLPNGNKPTLDRINLETWEGASKKSTQSESNPLLAFVKAFISSFVKFWTE